MTGIPRQLPVKSTSFDSTLDTMRHSRRVDELILHLIVLLQLRITQHDLSKMEEPEKSTFDEATDRLKDTPYGSDAYKANLAEMLPALQHHYRHNSHHPEHFENGINGMTLIDLIEMLADWKASTERTVGGDLTKSLAIQKHRFDIDDQLFDILWNTARELRWV